MAIYHKHKDSSMYMSATKFMKHADKNRSRGTLSFIDMLPSTLFFGGTFVISILMVLVDLYR